MDEQRDKLGRFVKGVVPYIKGKTHTLKTRKKLSIANKGGNSTSFKKGHKVSKKTREAVSKQNRERIYTEKIRRNKHNGMTKGEKNHLWKGGITEMNDKIRTSLEYKLWRDAVYKRDNFTCRFCGKRGGDIEADHIKPFAHYPELRFAIDNGRTLCKECHRKTETYGRYI